MQMVMENDRLREGLLNEIGDAMTRTVSNGNLEDLVEIEDG